MRKESKNLCIESNFPRRKYPHEVLSEVGDFLTNIADQIAGILCKSKRPKIWTIVQIFGRNLSLIATRSACRARGQALWFVRFFGEVVFGSDLEAFEVVFGSSRRSTLQGFWRAAAGFCSGISVIGEHGGHTILDREINF